MSLLSLPSEILVGVVSYLPTRDLLHVRMTCRQLYSVLSDPIFWSTISWEDFNHVRDEKPLKTVLKLGAPLLHQLNISALDRFALSKFSTILKSCEKLKHLTLTGFKLSSDQLKTILTILPNIYHLEFDESFKCSYKNFFELAPLSSTLTSVILNKTSAYMAILNKWSETGFSPPEMGVRLSGPRSSCFSCIKFDRFNTPKHHARFCLYDSMNSPYILIQSPSTHPALELHFDPDFYMPYCKMFNSEHFICLGRSGKNYTRAEFVYRLTLPHGIASTSLPNTIRFLNFYDYRDLESVHLSLIADSCPNLYQLNLEHCHKSLNDLDGLSSIVKECKNLRSLNISRIYCNCEVRHGTEPCQVWQILSQAMKLTQLAIDMCLLSTSSPHGSTHQTQHQFLQGAGPRSRVSHVPSQSPEAVVQIERCLEKMVELRALNIRCICERINPELLLIPAKLKSLSYLHLKCMRTAPKADTVKKILLQHGLTYLQLSSLLHSDLGQLILPDDPNCYMSLQFLCITSRWFHLSDEVASAMSHHKLLTHITLLCYCTSPECLITLVCNSPRLVECHLRVAILNCYGQTLKEFSSLLKSELQKRGVKNSLNLTQRRLPSTPSLEPPSLW